MQSTFSAAILGASGYTGVELVRLLAQHPHAHITALAAERHAGKSLQTLFPNVAGLILPDMLPMADINYSMIDVVFLCLPHGLAHNFVQTLPPQVKVIDLSPDFRLFDIATYEQWYGVHHAPALQAAAVYGLPEHYRERIQHTRLIANPGCYPTASLMALTPLLQEQLIVPNGIIIDAKSGVSGAGRALREGSLAAEVQESIHAYGIGGHRHYPEITQGASAAAGCNVRLTFTPHLMPMNRGILATIYASLGNGVDIPMIRNALQHAYSDEPFIQVLPEGSTAAPRYVRGSNSCHISVHASNQPEQVIICSAIDNLIKGASGQAVQNANIMLGLREDAGLSKIGMFP